MPKPRSSALCATICKKTMLNEESDMSENNNEKMAFEAAMARLEQIVLMLEGGKATLDESLSLYEEGIALVKLCSNRLDEAEQKIKIIRTAADGTKAEEDFEE